MPVGLTQAAIDAAILTAKKETMKRESTIEQLARDADEQVKKLERQLNEISTKPSSLSETISQVVGEKPIRHANRNLKVIEQNDNSELRKLIQETNDRLSQLEKRFDQLPQSTSIDNTRIRDKESNGQSSTTEKKKSREQKNNKGGDAEREFHNDHIPDLQEKLNNYSIIIQDLQKRIESLDKTKADRQTVDDPAKAGEQQNKMQSNDSRKRINKIEGELSKTNTNLAALHRQMTQKSKSTTVPLTKKDSTSTAYTEEKLQAVMPFIEPLPTFDLLIKNEWNPIY